MGKHIGTFYDLQGPSLHIRHINCLDHRVPPNRGAITEFSCSSAARMRRYLRKCRADYQVMCTLTYPSVYPKDGASAKNHLRVFLQRWRRRANDESYSAFWFIEFQARGAPHFHIFCTHQAPKEWIADAWYSIVKSNDPRHQVAGTRIEAIHSGRRGTISYASKYASKFDQKTVPKGYSNCGRFWGIHGNRTTVEATILVKDKNDAYSSYPRFRNELSGLVDGAKINQIHPGYSVIYLPTDEMAKKVRSTMLRYGLMMHLHGSGVVNFSTMGVEEE